MNHKQDNTTEVLIVGAGPTGLMMACQLAVHQVKFRIIDKSAHPSNSSGALIVQARSLEIFEQMGIAREALAAGIIANKINLLYNGKKIASTAIRDIGGSLSQFPFLLMLEQSKTEKLFINFISQRGYEVERGICFKSFIQEKEDVTSLIILPDGSEQSIKTKYVIASDGANSNIRDFLNIPFEGKTYPKPLFILDCKATTELNPGEIYFTFSKNSIAGFFPLNESRWRIDSNLPKELEKTDPITFDHIEQDIQLWTKVNIAFQGYEWFSVSHAQQKYASSVRVRNCFLAGDSAHVNTPIGAQGMNTGLQDAYNLAWKLAFVIKHKAKPDLLDTYAAERSGISKGFAHYADIVFKLVTSKNTLVVFFRIYMLRLILMVLFSLLEKRNAFSQIFFKSISQIGIHYHDSILSYKESGGRFKPGVPGPGDRFPYVDFIHKGRKTDSYKILTVGCFSIIVLASDLPEEIKILSEKYGLATEVINRLPDTEKLYESLGMKNTGYVLIRPDYYIALRSAALNIHHLNNYLKQFLTLS